MSARQTATLISKFRKRSNLMTPEICEPANVKPRGQAVEEIQTVGYTYRSVMNNFAD
jgi:hypothetical protein